MQGGIKNRDFVYQYLALSRKWYKIELYLQWPTNRKSYMFYRTALFLMTLNPYFKVTPLFNAEYLRNGTRYIHSYNKILIGTYALLKSVISNGLVWPWVTYSITRSIARSLWQLTFLSAMLFGLILEARRKILRTISHTVIGRFSRYMVKWYIPARGHVHCILALSRILISPGVWIHLRIRIGIPDHLGLY